MKGVDVLDAPGCVRKRIHGYGHFFGNGKGTRSDYPHTLSRFLRDYAETEKEVAGYL